MYTVQCQNDKRAETPIKNKIEEPGLPYVSK